MYFIRLFFCFRKLVSAGSVCYNTVSLIVSLMVCHLEKGADCMNQLLVLEGLDGSGKSTQTALLRQTLLENDIPVKQIKLPDYDSPSSTLVQMYLNGAFGSDPNAVGAYAASAFYAVDRYASFQTAWKEAYENGTLILADRYATSNASYQMTKLPQEEWSRYLMWLEDFEYRKMGIPAPTLVVFLDMPVEVSQKLMTSRYQGDESKKDVHEKDVSYLQHCRNAALFAAKQQGWVCISCAENGQPKSIETIAAEVRAVVQERLHLELSK